MDTTIQKNRNYFLKDDTQQIKEILLNDGIILYPTDTIWGVGCDATNPVAIERIYNLKERDRSKPFVLLVSDIDMLKNYIEAGHPRMETLLSFHVRPLTVIYDKGKNLPANAVSGDGSVAIRIVKDVFCQQLISDLGRPLVASSANISGQPFPANFGEVSSEVIQGVDYVVNHRRDDKTVSEPSVIVKCTPKGELVFIRE